MGTSQRETILRAELAHTVILSLDFRLCWRSLFITRDSHSPVSRYVQTGDRHGVRFFRQR
jgi:hypothetical protein